MPSFCRNYNLLAKYFEPTCQSVFVRGLLMENFVPAPPTAVPTDIAPAKNMSGTDMYSLGQISRHPVVMSVIIPRCAPVHPSTHVPSIHPSPIHLSTHLPSIYQPIHPSAHPPPIHLPLILSSTHIPSTHLPFSHPSSWSIYSPICNPPSHSHTFAFSINELMNDWIIQWSIDTDLSSSTDIHLSSHAFSNAGYRHMWAASGTRLPGVSYTSSCVHTGAIAAR